MSRLTMTFRGFRRKEGLKTLIQERFAKLERTADKPPRARVLVDRPHRSRQKGQSRRVQITLWTGARPVIVTREEADTPVSAMINDCFDTAERQLRERRPFKRSLGRQSVRRAA